MIWVCIPTMASTLHVSKLVHQDTWSDLAAVLNTLIKIEYRQNPLSQEGGDRKLSLESLVPNSRDELPLPEDYLIRGLIWTEECLPAKWFNRGIDLDSFLENRPRLKCALTSLRKLFKSAVNLGLVHPYKTCGLLLTARSSKVFAFNNNVSTVPAQLLRDPSIFDNVLYGLTLPAMALLWLAGARSIQPSLTIMLLFAFLFFAATNTSSLFDIRTTYVDSMLVL